MDAVKFVNERNRMCDYYKKNCTGCPLNGKPCIGFRSIDVESTVAEVEAWSAAHPLKTRQSVFLEQYPEALIDSNGVLDVCPAPIFHSHRSDRGGCIYYNRKCADCCREFWLQEVE